MKRPSHLDPAPRELLTRPKSHGGWYILQDEPEPVGLNPVEIVLLTSGGLSLLAVVCCVIMQVFQSMSSDPDYEAVGKVLDVLWWSVAGLIASVGLLLVWNRFVRHG